MAIKKFRINYLYLLPFIIILIGSICFMFLENLSFLDAAYLTIVTISTVGYGDIHPTTTASKIFGVILIVFGIGTFLTIVSSITQLLVQRGRDRLRRQRLHMIIGVFFTEVGNTLLSMLVKFDGNIESIRDEFAEQTEWNVAEFSRLRYILRLHQAEMSPQTIDFKQLADFLGQESDILLRQIENPDLIEHEFFTELLWATVHLRDELMYRDDFSTLPESDLIHLANDIKRAYGLLTRQWLDYLVHLRDQYPYLFSLALRTNPFLLEKKVIVE